MTLLALALRVAGLDRWGSLDFDEQATFFIASMPPGEMLRYLLGAPFEHPPLFYLLFHGWLAAVGGSETAMRVFAVIPGTLAVPLLGYAVARVTDTRTGVVAAAALALAPLHVFHSRDARMYTLLALFMTGILAVLAARGRWRAAVVSILALAALATHYYAVFGALGVLAGWAWHQRRATASGEAGGWRLRGWWTAVAVGGLAVGGALIWLTAASGLRTSLTAVSPRPVDPSTLGWALVQSLGADLAGPLASPAMIVVAATATAALLALGWISVVSAPTRRGTPSRGPGASASVAPGRGALVSDTPRDGSSLVARNVKLAAPTSRLALGSRSLLAAACWGGFVLTTIGVPLLLFLGRPFAPRFVVLAAPFLAAALALGTFQLGPRVFALAATGYVAVAAVGLAPMYGDYQRSDYGAALDRVRAEVRADDGVVLNGPWQDLLYRRYGAGLPAGRIVASTVPLQVDETTGWLQRITAEHPRVWVIDSATDLTDPTGAVAAWMDANAYPRPVIEYEKAVLRPYLTERGATLTARPIDVTSLGIRITSVAMDRWTLAAGEESRLRIEGRAAAETSGLNARAVVDLLSPDGSSVWHWDGPLTRLGEWMTYRAAIVTPDDVSPGEYRVVLTAYEVTRREGSMPRVLRLSEGVDVGMLVVAPRASELAG